MHCFFNSQLGLWEIKLLNLNFNGFLFVHLLNRYVFNFAALDDLNTSLLFYSWLCYNKEILIFDKKGLSQIFVFNDFAGDV